MKTTKSIYITPNVELIILDKEISLVLQSDVPPEGPDEGFNVDNFNVVNLSKSILSYS